MKTKLMASVALLAVSLVACVPMFAHHGNTAYETEKVVILKNATVTTCGDTTLE